MTRIDPRRGAVSVPQWVPSDRPIGTRLQPLPVPLASPVVPPPPVRDLVFRTNGFAVKVTRVALLKIDRHRQHRPEDLEAEGVLVGRHLEAPSGDVLVVEDASEPGPMDNRRRYGVYVQDPCHQALVDQHHAESDGRSGYLGRWHTHPEPDPTPSAIDLADWRRRAASPLELVGSKQGLVFMISGQVEIRAWLVTREGDVTELIGAWL